MGNTMHSLNCENCGKDLSDWEGDVLAHLSRDGAMDGIERLSVVCKDCALAVDLQAPPISAITLFELREIVEDFTEVLADLMQDIQSDAPVFDWTPGAVGKLFALLALGQVGFEPECNPNASRRFYSQN